MPKPSITRTARACASLIALATLAAIGSCSDDDGTTSPVSASDLAGRAFEVSSLAVDGDPVDLADAGHPRRVVWTEGRVQLDDGCNGRGMRYELEGGRLEMSDVSSSLRQCRGDIGSQANLIASAFVTGARVESSGTGIDVRSTEATVHLAPIQSG